MRTLNLIFKRAFDIIASLLGIIILIVIPVFIIVPIAIKLTSKGPIIYKQVRAGYKGKSFTIYKFRTMEVLNYDEKGNEILPENRITKVGKILRATSLDEIPQLFNVLLGQMSFIGPRPMLLYQAERCINNESDRFKMLPGITGWAQVQGRNNLMWEDRIVYDIEYINNFTILMDIKVVFKTAIIVLKRDGTNVTNYDRTLDRFSKHYIDKTVEKQKN